jgi:hypothetical protein
MKTTRYLDICTVDGRVLFSFCLTEREEKEQPVLPDEKTSQPQDGKQRTNGDTGEKMTSPQKRKLFRLLAIKGLTGNEAEAELKKRFQATDLNNVSKAEASQMIDKMLKEEKGGN